MAVLKSPKNQSSKRTWIRLFYYRTKYLKFISKKAYYNRNFSVIPLKWNAVYNNSPLQPFDSDIENNFFSFYLYPYFLYVKKTPLKNSRFFIIASKKYYWKHLKVWNKSKSFMKVTDKKIDWNMIPIIN